MRSFEVARKIVDVEKIGEDGKVVMVKDVQIIDGEDVLAYPDAQLPMYMTKYAAGADFFAAEDTVIPSIWKQALNVCGQKASAAVKKICDMVAKELGYQSENNDKKPADILPTLVHTGIKANMEDDEVLIIANRSSGPKKMGLILANSIGIIDKDYYNNPDNDGEIMFAFYNVKLWDTHIKKGDRIGQGMFQKILRPEVGLRVKDVDRESGFGSTNK